MKNLFTYIGEVVDYFSKNIDRVKTIGQILLVGVFIASLSGNGCQRNRIIEIVNKFTKLEFMNNILHQNIARKDSTLFISRIEIDSLNVVIAGLKEDAEILEGSESALRANLRQLRDSVMKVPDSYNYSFLQEKAYPYEGKKIYPFNRKQIKEIHLDYLENKDLWFLNENLTYQVDNCREILHVKEEIEIKNVADISNLESQKEDYEKIIDNKDEENKLLKKEVKKEKRGKGAWKILVGILTVALAVVGL